MIPLAGGHNTSLFSAQKRTQVVSLSRTHIHALVQTSVIVTLDAHHRRATEARKNSRMPLFYKGTLFEL